MSEYRRQWIADLKRKGLYKEPDKDSLRIISIEDSLRTITDKNLRSSLIYKRDSLKLRFNERQAAKQREALKKKQVQTQTPNKPK